MIVDSDCLQTIHRIYQLSTFSLQVQVTAQYLARFGYHHSSPRQRNGEKKKRFRQAGQQFSEKRCEPHNSPQTPAKTKCSFNKRLNTILRHYASNSIV